jgi:hypothetical protein
MWSILFDVSDRKIQSIWIALLGLGMLLGQSDRSLAICPSPEDSRLQAKA